MIYLKRIWPKREYNGHNNDTPITITSKISGRKEKIVESQSNRKKKVVLIAPYEACKYWTQTKAWRYSIFAIDGIIWGSKVCGELSLRGVRPCVHSYDSSTTIVSTFLLLKDI
jgi:hypothetical protein